MRPLGGFPPLVWMTAALGGGITVAEVYPVAETWTWLAVAGAGLLCVAGLVPGVRRAALPVSVLAFGLLGMANAGFHVASQPGWPREVEGQWLAARGVVQSPPEPAGGGWRAVFDLTDIEPAHPDAATAPRRIPRGAVPAPSIAGTARAQAVRGSVRVSGRGQQPDVDTGDHVLLRGWFHEGRPAGNAGERSERDALRRRGLSGAINVGVAGVAVVRRGGWSPLRAINAIRRQAVDAILRALPAPYSGLLLSLLLGIDGFIGPDLYRQFVRAGLVHLMVVSGSQVAIVAGAMAAAARLARLPAGISAAVTAAGIALFAAMVGWAPSIGRAVVMGAVGLAGAVLGRERDRGATLAAAALALLALNPPVLFDIGFQLSFAATWGLLYAAPALQRWLSAWGSPLGPVGAHLAAALSVTLGAHLAVTPLLALHFQSIPIAGLAANLLALPLIALLVPAGFALMPVLLLLPAAGAWAFSLFRPALSLLLWISGRFGSLPWATMVTPPVPAAVAAASYGMLGGVIAISSGSWRPPRWQRITAAAFGLFILTAWYATEVRSPPGLVITVLDVGQGDAILIQSPAGRTALVDGGGEVGAERGGWDIGLMRVVPALRRAGVRRLDAVLLSHPHEDHVGGLPAVVENFPVGLVVDPGVPHPSPSYTRLLRMIEAGRIPYRQAREGQSIDLGLGARLTILYPPDPAPELDGNPVHARSVMARLTYGRTAVLLAGDIEGPVERFLVDRGIVLASQVLKVGHHGSKTSTTPMFLAQVKPQIAVISVGAGNSFGHPHPATLDALAAARVSVYRTDRHGAVRVTSDGTTVRVETARRVADREANDARVR